MIHNRLLFFCAFSVIAVSGMEEDKKKISLATGGYPLANSYVAQRIFGFKLTMEQLDKMDEREIQEKKDLELRKNKLSEIEQRRLHALQQLYPHN